MTSRRPRATIASMTTWDRRTSRCSRRSVVVAPDWWSGSPTAESCALHPPTDAQGHAPSVELRPRSHSAQRSQRRASARPRPGTGPPRRTPSGRHPCAPSPSSWPASAGRCCRSSTRSSPPTGTSHDDDVPVVAEVLNLSRADVHGVADLLPRPAPHSPARAPGRAVPRRGLPGPRRRGTCTPWPPTAGRAPPTSRWARSSASGCAPSGRRAPSTAPCTPRCPPSGSTP